MFHPCWFSSIWINLVDLIAPRRWDQVFRSSSELRTLVWEIVELTQSHRGLVDDNSNVQVWKNNCKYKLLGSFRPIAEIKGISCVTSCNPNHVLLGLAHVKSFRNLWYCPKHKRLKKDHDKPNHDRPVTVIWTSNYQNVTRAVRVPRVIYRPQALNLCMSREYKTSKSNLGNWKRMERENISCNLQLRIWSSMCPVLY